MRANELVESAALMPGVNLSRTADLVHVSFARPHRALSSAVLNGGFCHASDFVNARVARHTASPVEEPAMTLLRLAARTGQNQAAV